MLRPQLLAHTATALGRVGIAQVRQATALPAGPTSTFDPLPSGPALDHRIVGSALYVSAPTGMFTPGTDSMARCSYAAVAAGSGITPIVSIIGTVLESEPHSTFTLYY